MRLNFYKSLALSLLFMAVLVKAAPPSSTDNQATSPPSSPNKSASNQAPPSGTTPTAQPPSSQPTTPPPSASAPAQTHSQAPPPQDTGSQAPQESQNPQNQNNQTPAAASTSSTTSYTGTAYGTTYTSTFTPSSSVPSPVPSVNVPCVSDPNNQTKFTCPDPSLYCDVTQQICQTKLNDSQPCTDSSQCQSGNCVSSVCAASAGNNSSVPNSNSDTSNGTDNNVGAKVGIVAGVVVGIIAAIGVAFWLFGMVKKHRYNSRTNYYEDDYDSSQFAEPSYPFAGRNAAFSSANAPPPLTSSDDAMDEPIQRRTSGLYNGTGGMTQMAPVAVASSLGRTNTTTRGPQGTQLPPLSFNNTKPQQNPRNQLFDGWDFSNERYPGTNAPQQQRQQQQQQQHLQPSSNNRISNASTVSRLSKYNYLTKVFSHMRASQSSGSQNLTSPEMESKADAESINIVYQVANPQQGREFRNNLAEAAKAIANPVAIDMKDSADLTEKKKNQSEMALRDSNVLPLDDQNEIGHTTESLYLGVDVNDIVQPVDYTSPNANGRYKMSSMYSTYSRDSNLFTDMPAMPPLGSPRTATFNALNGNNKTTFSQSPEKVAEKRTSTASTATNQILPRSSAFSLQAPIFKAFKRSNDDSIPPTPALPSEHQRNPSQSSQSSLRKVPLASQQSPLLRHQRDLSQSSQVSVASPLRQQAHLRNLSKSSQLSRNPSKSSQLSAESKYSQSSESSGYSPVATTPPRVVVSPSASVNSNDSRKNNTTTATYNLNRHSMLTDIPIESIDFNYVVPEMSTIEEKIAEEEYAMSQKSQTSSYAPSIASEADIDQDLDAIRKFAEDAWSTMNSNSAAITGTSDGSTAVSRSISKASTVSSSATITGQIQTRFGKQPTKTVEEEDLDYQFF